MKLVVVWRSYLLLLLKIFLIAGACETVVMYALDTLLPGHTTINLAVIDALALTLLASPLIFWVFVRHLSALTASYSQVRKFAQQTQVRLDESILEHQALMSTVSTHALISETDPDGVITSVNQAFIDASGYSREELIGQTHRIVGTGHQSPAYWNAMWKSISAGKPWHGQICNRTKSGDSFWTDTLVAPYRDRDGNITKYISIRLNITEAKRAEAMHDRERNRLNSVIRGANVGTWEIDLITGENWIDEQWAGILGYELHELVPFDRTRFKQLVHPDDLQLVAQRMADLIHGRSPKYRVEYRMRHKNGHWCWILSDGAVSKAMTDGTPEIISGIHRDVSERQAYVESLIEAREKAEQATRSKADFLANMSHEIRTPMNAILGMLTLLERSELSSRQFDYASKAKSATRSLLSIVNDILDFSKVEAGKMQLEQQPFEVSKLLQDLSVILSANVGSKPVEVLYDISPDMPAALVGDAMRLQQVLINLGGNAVKFTPQGHIVIGLHCTHKATEGAEVRFSVTDTGIGISPENRARIFEGFSQAEASTTRQYGGTGLGLAISQRLVALMGGALELDSTMGSGSTFYFSLTLPVASQDEPAFEDAKRSPRTVLIVESNPVAAQLLANFTQTWKWPTQTVERGEEALARIAHHASIQAPPFDVIYVDWHLQGMDGWETTQKLRSRIQELGLTQPTIVMLSSNLRSQLSHRTQEEQALLNAFLVKPISPRMLLDATAHSDTSHYGLRHVARDGASQRRLRGMRILVVEDNQINQQVAEELLLSEGAEVTLAANGQIGVEAVEAASPPFDVVLMDLQMPVMDGFTATRQLRTTWSADTLPIVAMTANAQASDREACLAAGMNEHVSKPFDLHSLVATLLHITAHPMDAAPHPSSHPEDSHGQTAPTGWMAPQISAHTATTPAGEGANDIPILDMHTALRRLGGAQSIYVRSLKDFDTMLEKTHSDLNKALAPNAASAQKDTAKAMLHSLKGTAATLGAMRVSALAAKLEKQVGRTPGTTLSEADVQDLFASMHATRQAIPQVVDSLESQIPRTEDAPPKATDSISHETLQALDALAQLARNDDLGALEYFAQHRQVLSTLQPEFLAELEIALQSLDLAQVASQCSKARLMAGERSQSQLLQST